MRYVPLIVIVAGLVVGVAIPWVNSPALWFGVPAMIVWSVAGVALLTPALALVEFTRRPTEGDEPR